MVEGAVVVGVMLHVMQIFWGSRENHVICEDSSALSNGSQLFHQLKVIQVYFLHVVHHDEVKLPVVFNQLLHTMQSAIVNRHSAAHPCVLKKLPGYLCEVFVGLYCVNNGV
jgi:hypothetical protein